MNQVLIQHIKNLKDALLSLPATGESGFEGLISVTLQEITGVPFRISGSGSQFGVDGKPIFDEDAICFEAKRYDGPVPRAEVISKIADLSICGNEVDIWVLCATSQIRPQLVDDAIELGNKNGIFVLILDWSEEALPPLGVALSMGKERVQEFLKRNISEPKKYDGAITALYKLKSSKDFFAHAERISAQCNEPSIGCPLVRRANADWLTDVFSSRKQAKIKLGQPLSPGDNSKSIIKQRKNLIEKLNPFFKFVTKDTVVCILGGEGNGKSWIVAQTWLAQNGNKPLMAIMSPDDFTGVAIQNNYIDLLIFKLIKQTGQRDNEVTRQRWHRKLSQWQNRSSTGSPRIIAVIDGINQRQKLDWARIIDNISYDLTGFGGCLIVTVRTPFFKDYVKNRLSTDFVEISVPEWTGAERNEILADHGVNTSDIHSSVAISLQNPRLLGIAIELLDKEAIKDLDELNGSCLLFEHMRMSERDSPDPQPVQEFASQLQRHAQEILNRVKKNQQDDLCIFEQEMGAVADGRFFHMVEGDPTRYYLKDDVLTLALAFCLLDRLRTAKRNHRNLDEELEAILEPILALRDTADVILAALTVVRVDHSYDQDISTSLVKGFSALQNPDQTKFSIFVNLAENMPQNFMETARTISLAGSHQLNLDWIQEALFIASRNDSAWQKMTDNVKKWLSIYSLSPEFGDFSRDMKHVPAKGEIEQKNKAKKIEDKVRNLSADEQIILENLQKTDGDFKNLSHLSFSLLAGKSLEPFAECLRNWSFSFALNPVDLSLYKGFINLVRFNKTDWSNTRIALLKSSEIFRKKEVSTTGKWALVNILRATGNSDDGMEERFLVKELLKDRPQLENWRLIEKYCETDPCDPMSNQPNNINQTEIKYNSIDVKKLRQNMYQESEDHFFVMARPGMVRFKPEVAISKHREFATDIVDRKGLPLKHGLFELLQHTPLLSIEDANKFVKKWYETKGNSNNDAWIVSQYHLLIAYPFLSPCEQANILMSFDGNDKILQELMNISKPLSENDFEAFLEKACLEGNESNQYFLLALANSVPINLSETVRTRILELFNSGSDRLRIQALGIISKSDDKYLVSQVAKSGWQSTSTEKNDLFENWYGSSVLLKAAKNGIITHNETLNRISARLYGRAATILDGDSAKDIARRIDESIKKTLELEGNLVAPNIEIKIHSSTYHEPDTFSVDETSKRKQNISDILDRLSESNEDFKKRQAQYHKAFSEFEEKITKARAQIILNSFSLEGFARIVECSRDFANRWYDLFMNIAEEKLPTIYNIVLLLAHGFGFIDTKKAEDLFFKIKDINPIVNLSFGKVGIPFDSLVTWAGTRNSTLDRLRLERLDQVGNDNDLSLEVLSALLNDKQELLSEYIKSKLKKQEPSEISRGIMVSGFSDQNKFNDETLKRYENSAGLIGEAQKSANYAYKRNLWSRYWFEKMCETEKNSDFWRYTVLFLKIIDGRFNVWCSEYDKKGSPIKLFDHTIDSKFKYRLDRWANHRKKKLFGLEAPASIFL